MNNQLSPLDIAKTFVNVPTIEHDYNDQLQARDVNIDMLRSGLRSKTGTFIFGAPDTQEVDRTS